MEHADGSEDLRLPHAEAAEKGALSLKEETLEEDAASAPTATVCHSVCAQQCKGTNQVLVVWVTLSGIEVFSQSAKPPAAGSDGSDDGDDLGDAEFERAAARAGAGGDSAGADAARLRSGSEAAASGSDSDRPAQGSPREGVNPGGARPPAAGNKAASFARAFAKVMASGAGKGVPGAAPILVGSKSLGKRKREEAEAERGDRAARKLRTEMRRRGHIVRPGARSPVPFISSRGIALLCSQRQVLWLLALAVHTADVLSVLDGTCVRVLLLASQLRFLRLPPQVILKKGDDPASDAVEKALMKTTTRCGSAFAAHQIPLSNSMTGRTRTWHMQAGAWRAWRDCAWRCQCQASADCLPACRGVVRLFNALAKAQRAQREAAGGSARGRKPANLEFP